MRQDFVEYVKNHIKDYLPEDYHDAKIILEKVTKGNDRILTGLTICKAGEQVTQTFYLEPYDFQHKNGRPLDSILQEIASIKMENSGPLPFDVEKLNDYEAIKSMLAIRLCDTEKNQEYLKDKPYTMCGDLAATYRVHLFDSSEGIASVVITNQMLEVWKIALEELSRDAVTAENEREPICFYTMADQMSEIRFATKPTNLFDRSEPLSMNFSPMYVLTNQSKTNGAGVLARDGVLDKIGELIGSDYYILPSSLHKLLIIPDDGNIQIKELENMVREVNATEVAPEDFLSDKVQYYDRETKTLGRKQEKGLLNRLSDNKIKVQEKETVQPDKKHPTRLEPSL